jgi:menaquinone-dependent protoporphyrinogen IX oxidase
MRTLIVFYTRTGTTGKVAQALSERCGAEIEQIRDVHPRRGLLRGWWRSIREVRRRSEAEILTTGKQPQEFDLVILGTPVWAGSMSSPLRTWINRNRSSLEQVAVFVTQGGRGGEKAAAQVAELCGTAPVARLVVNAKDLASAKFEKQLDEFVAGLNIPVGGRLAAN